MKKRRDYCRVVLVTSLAWLFSMSIFMVYVLDSGVRTTENEKQAHKQAEDTHDGHDLPPNELSDVPSPRHVRGDRRPQARKETLAPAPVEGVLARLMRGLSLSNGGPGENGRPVRIPSEQEAEMKRLFKSNQFNIMASDMISLNRSLPDYRSAACRAKSYASHMPTVSIIIVFHNEAWSTLLRSLHSVLNRSPQQLLHEIILVNDYSDRDYLREPLQEYISRFPIKATLLHMPERSGLIRARLTGANIATGQVLLFLDAHVEVTIGWLQPLLSRIQQNKKRVVAPIIDVISDDTFEYVTASDMTWGGFNWHLNFRWYSVPQRELNRRNGDRSEPIQTPTIAGGLFAIDRDYFYEIGTYDEGMQVWGGENLEISFRVWMCGGALEIVPCSRVGHVFRKQTPYSFPGGTATVIHRNAARTAQVWMDQYKQFFYQIVPAARTVEIGDVTDRQQLRKRLECKSFNWYLQNIYKESPVPATFYSIGAIWTTTGEGAAHQCLDTLGHKEGQAAGLSVCHAMGGNQAWSLTGKHELRSDEVCLSVASRGAVSLARCSDRPEQVWIYEPNTRWLRHSSSSQCLSSEGDKLSVSACSPTLSTQQWTLDNYSADLHGPD